MLGLLVAEMQVSEHVWGGWPRGVGELPAGGIRASQGTFSSICKYVCHAAVLLSCRGRAEPNVDRSCN